MNKFQNRALKTLHEMNTTSKDWYIPPIKWMKSKLSKESDYVALILWNKETIFDSRFRKESRLNCELCANPIKHRNHFIPVEAVDKNGVYHGMWVGRDCANNFLNLTLPKELKDSQIIVPTVPNTLPIKKATILLDPPND